VTARLVLAAVAALAAGGHALGPASLPVCRNRTLAAVVERVGCTVGDARCWMRSKGFCTDWIEARLRADQPGKALRVEPVAAAEVRAGDVAVFSARVHYAYVERVIAGPDGRPVAVDLSEYNLGTCWVDRDVMVTDQYRTVSRRAAVAVAAIDGGFLRARPVAR
jgi:hypothetical protein